MSFIRHENIKVLENALQWWKNGILRIFRGFRTEKMAMQLQPVRVATCR